MQKKISGTVLVLMLTAAMFSTPARSQSELVAPDFIEDNQRKSSWIKGRKMELRGRADLEEYTLEGNKLRDDLVKLIDTNHDATEKSRSDRRKLIIQITSQIDKLDDREDAARNLINKGLALQSAAERAARKRMATR
jgi:hypothetical protein